MHCPIWHLAKKCNSNHSIILCSCNTRFLDTPKRFRDHSPLYATAALYRNGSSPDARRCHCSCGVADRHASWPSRRNSPLGGALCGCGRVSDSSHAALSSAQSRYAIAVDALVSGRDASCMVFDRSCCTVHTAHCRTAKCLYDVMDASGGCSRHVDPCSLLSECDPKARTTDFCLASDTRRIRCFWRRLCPRRCMGQADRCYALARGVVGHSRNGIHASRS